jgi:hypothetical protein
MLDTIAEFPLVIVLMLLESRVIKERSFPNCPFLQVPRVGRNSEVGTTEKEQSWALAPWGNRFWQLRLTAEVGDGRCQNGIAPRDTPGFMLACRDGNLPSRFLSSFL